MPDVSFLADVLVFLIAAVIVAPVFQRLRSNLFVGYLVAGVLIGPHGMALVQSSATSRGLAELGVTFLLFTIGLELSIERLRTIRKYIFGLGSAQLAITGAAIGAIALSLGVRLEGAIVIGAALALSSTAVVMQLLSERRELATRVGRIALAILLLQDLAVVPLIALVPALSGGEASIAETVIWTFLKAAAAIALIVVLGRVVLRPLFRTIAVGRSPEMFAAVTLLVLLGAAWTTSRFGLSLAIGGFLAGLLLAETEYRHQVAAEIAPFRGLLLGLFFMTVGMEIDLGLVVESPAITVALIVGLLALKWSILTVLCLAARNPVGPSLHVGALLAQGGEFAFIMFALAMATGILDLRLGGLLVLAVAVSMAVTPVLAALGRRAEVRLGQRVVHSVGTLEDETRDLSDHVILAGFGRVGQSVAKTLSAAQIPFVGLEYEPTRVARCRERGQPVYFGDASRPEVLRAVGAQRARAAVVTMDDPDAAEQAVHLLHSLYPALHIFVRARDSDHRQRLETAGATVIVHETFELSLQLGGSVLRRMGTTDEEIQEIIHDLRAEDYARLSDVVLPATDAAAGRLKPRNGDDQDDGGQDDE